MSGHRRERRQWPLTARLYVALATMAALAALVSLALGGIRSG